MNEESKTLGQIAQVAVGSTELGDILFNLTRDPLSGGTAPKGCTRWEAAAQAVRQHVLETETEEGWRLMTDGEKITEFDLVTTTRLIGGGGGIEILFRAPKKTLLGCTYRPQAKFTAIRRCCCFLKESQPNQNGGVADAGTAHDPDALEPGGSEPLPAREEWRMLEAGEIIQEGDEWLNELDGDKWSPATHRSIGVPLAKSLVDFCRRRVSPVSRPCMERGSPVAERGAPLSRKKDHASRSVNEKETIHHEVHRPAAKRPQGNRETPPR